jgi:ribonuclease BN (tRNA processing enzyme)
VAAEKMKTVRERLYCEDLFPVRPNFELRELKTNGKTKLGTAGLLTAFPVDHPGGCHSFRIDWADSNRSFAYVTDTTACLQAPYVQQIQGVETLIHECYFPDGWDEKAKLTGHSCLTPVAEVARAAGVGRCLLVHVDPLDESESPLDLKSIKGIFKNMSVAEDFQVIDI